MGRHRAEAGPQGSAVQTAFLVLLQAIYSCCLSGYYVGSDVSWLMDKTVFTEDGIGSESFAVWQVGVIHRLSHLHLRNSAACSVL